MSKPDKTKKQLEALLSVGPAVIYTAEPSGDYRATFISENVKAEMGYEASDFIEDSKFWKEHIHPDDVARVIDDLKVLDEKGHYEYEYRFLHKDGTYRWMYDEVSLSYDAEGKPVEAIGYWIDITERKAAEEELKRAYEGLEKRVKDRTRELTKQNEVRKLAEETLKKTQDNLVRAQEVAHIGSWHLDLIINKLVWTEENHRIFGIPKGTSLTYEKFLKVVHPDDRAYVDKEWTAAMAGKPYDIEHRLLVGDEVKWVREKAELMFDHNGNPVSAIGITQDITDKVLKEKDLQKLAGYLIVSQEKALSGIARELHDDLTQRLAIAAIDAGAIEQEFNDIPEAALQKIVHMKEQLIKMSEDVHDIARDIHPSILDDLGLVRAIQSECIDLSARTGVAVIFTPKNVPDNIPKDIALSVYRIIQEGLTNIFKHADVKNAYVFLEGLDDRLLLNVRDTGVGFEHGKIGQLATLGLGSIRERARLVDGRSSIISSPGKGTTIEVSIPLKGGVA